jgi:hypothetical protein
VRPFLGWVDLSSRFSATECLLCYMIHHVAQSATHKFALIPKTGEGILV